MKIGVCAAPENLPLLKELGYDYFEPRFNWMTALDDRAFAEQTALVEKYGIPAEAFCVFFKGDAKLYAQDGNQDPLLREIFNYSDAGFARAATWGCKIVVIGSGFVRGIPQGMTREETERQFARVLATCGEAADKYGIRLVVEPLSYCDCNYIHTVEEAAAVATLSGHHAVGALVDFYHHNNNNDDLEGLPRFASQLWHAHYARPVDRFVPEAGDVAHMQTCAEVLKKCPLIERITLECVWKPDYDTAIRATRPHVEVFRGV